MSDILNLILLALVTEETTSIASNWGGKVFIKT